MRKIIFFIFIAFISGVVRVNAQEEKKACGNEAAWQQAILIDPSLIQKRQQMEDMIDKYLKDQASARTTDDDDSVRIIPVVFHVLQDGGSENIPDDNIKSCITVINTDYSRQNFDTTETPPAFRPVAANTKIQFRLATIDPNGNCTNGIDRIYTNRTEEFTDFTKAVSDWPSNKYLNIWSSKFISVGAPTGQVILGYSYLPLDAPSAAVEGVAIRFDYIGSIGVAGNNNWVGRNADHEIGHYLDMIHIWGDADCGDDKCADTPTQLAPNSFDCPPYPHISCGNNGDMSQNYMDYTNGVCKNIWTKDQKARMRAALDVARFSLWQPSNLAATGTADPYVYPVAACPPNADFLPVHKNLCLGSSISFGTSTSTGGIATSWNWSFPGGTPSSSTNQTQLVSYNTPGVYSVTLTSTNAQGSSTITRDNVAIVDYGTGQNTLPYTQDFENPLSSDWVFFNDDGGPGWQRSRRASYSGSYSMSIQNFEATTNTAPGSVKEFYTPSYNFTGITKPVLSFRMSYGRQNSSNLDSLSIRATSNCGINWTGGGGELVHMASIQPNVLGAGSGGIQTKDFVPTHDQWLLVQIQLPPSYAGQKNVKFSFRFTTGILSNNIYIDDINIANGTVGINEEENNTFSFNAYPVPSSESFTVSYMLQHAEDLTINMYDLQGRLVRQIENKHATPGSYETKVNAKSFNLASGVYMLKMTTEDGVLSKKIVYSND